jgi:hypothetical protein
MSPGEHHFVRGVRTSTANNTTAYGYSLAVACSFAALIKVHGEPSWAELFLFVIGSCGGFALVNAAATRLYRKESPDEGELVISLATSLSVFSVSTSVVSAIGVGLAVPGRPSWLLAAFAFTVVYVLAVGAEVAIAARARAKLRR